KPIHQHRPRLRDAIDAPSRCRGLAGEAKARQRGTYDMKRIGRVAAMSDRIDQRLDHLVELHHRAWPAMGDDQRHRPLMRRADMDEVNAKPVDLGRELRKAIERGLAFAPMVLLGPITADLLDPREWRALAPVVDRFGLRPARVEQSRLEIDEHGIGHRDAERADSTHERVPYFFSAFSIARM